MQYGLLAFLLMMAWAGNGLAAPRLSLPQRASQVHADAAITFQGNQLVCDAYTTAGIDEVRALLENGAIVSSSWQVTIDRQRAYWLDAEVWSTEIIRQVTPDMLTGHWKLLDVKSGLSRTTDRLSEAVDFLMRMQHKPLLPLKLLQQIAHEQQNRPTFIMHIRAHFHDGSLSFSRWTYPFRLGKTVKVISFQLP